MCGLNFITGDLWVKKYLSIAEKIRSGEPIEIDRSLPEPFTEEEMISNNNAVNYKLTSKEG